MSSNDPTFGLDESGDPRTGFERSQAMERAKQRAARRRRKLRAESRREAAEEFDEDIGQRDITEEDIVREGDTFRLKTAVEREVAAIEFNEEFTEFEIGTQDVEASDEGFRLRDPTQRAIAASNFDEQFPTLDITASDVEIVEDGELQLTDEAASRIEVEQERLQEIERLSRELDARQAVAEELSDETGVDVGIEDIEVEDGELRPTDETQREIAAEQLDEETDVDITADDVELTEEGATIGREDLPQAGSEIEEAREEVEGVLGGDIGDIDPSDFNPDNITAAGDDVGTGDRASQDGEGSVFDDIEGLSAEAIPDSLGDVDEFVDGPEQKTPDSDTDQTFELSEEAQREVAAEQLDAEIESQEVTAEDVEQTESGGFQASEQLQREVAAAQLDQQTRADVTSEDVRVRDGRVGVTAETQREISAARLGVEPGELEEAVAARRLDRRFSGPVDLSAKGTSLGVATLKDTGLSTGGRKPLQQATPFVPDIDVEAGDVSVEDGQLQLDDELQSELAAQNLDARFPALDVSASDVAITEGRIQLQGDPGREVAARQLDRQLEGLRVQREDIRLTPEGAKPTEDLQQEIEQQQLIQAAREFSDKQTDESLPTPEPGEDVVIEGGRPQFTDEFRRELTVATIESSTPRNIQAGEDFDVDFVETRAGVQAVGAPGEVATVEFTAEGQKQLVLNRAEEQGELAGVNITDAEEQIKFDEEGAVVGIEEATPTTDQVVRSVTTLQEATAEALEPIADRLSGPVTAAESAAADVTPTAVTEGITTVAGAGADALGSGASFLSSKSAGVREVTESQLVDPLAARAGATFEFTAANPPIAVALDPSTLQGADFSEPDTAFGESVEDVAGTTGRVITTATVGAADVSTVESRSDAAVQSVRENISQPFGARLGRTAEIVGMNDPRFADTPISVSPVRRDDSGRREPVGFDNISEPETAGGAGVGNFFGGLTTGAAGITVGLPAEVIRGGRAVTGATTFTAEAISEEGVVGGAGTAATAGLAVGAKTATETLEQAEKRPGQTLGVLTSGAAVSTALSPVRVSRLSVPVKGETGTETVTLRGVRLTEPRALRGRVDTPGKTVAGLRGKRPTAGTPSVDPNRIDFNELEGRGLTTEPGGRFETDVFRAEAERAGPQAAERFALAESLVSQGARADSELQITDTEGIVRQAEEVPEGAAGPIADALQDLDATIFGSAAVRAQVPEARTPRDVDIAVDDPDAAKARLSEALDDFDAGPEIFDIKSRTEKATPGEIVKFGRLAQERLETDEGVKVTPAGEELLKKAGASAFLRGAGSPAPEFPGRTSAFDVGPEPVAEGGFVRAKDPADASLIATELVGTEGASRLSPLARVRARREARDISRFRGAFSKELERATAEQPDLDAPPAVLSRQRLTAFAREERAQAGLGPARFTVQDAREALESDAEDITTTRRRDSDSETSPSPGRRSPSFDRTVAPLAPISSGDGRARFESDVSVTPLRSSPVATARDAEPSPATSPSKTGRRVSSLSPDIEVESPLFLAQSVSSPTVSTDGADSPQTSGPPDANITSATIDSPTSPTPSGSPTPGLQTTITTQITTPKTGKKPRFDDSDEDGERFDLAFASNFAKRFGGGVATQESVLNAEGPADTEFTPGFEEGVEPATGVDLVRAEGDIPGDIQEDLEP